MTNINDAYNSRVRNQLEFMLRAFNLSESDAQTISGEIISRYSLIRRRKPL